MPTRGVVALIHLLQPVDSIKAAETLCPVKTADSPVRYCMSTPDSSLGTNHQQIPELPASRGRTTILVLIAFCSSIFFTGWISDKEHDSLTARLTVETTVVVAEHDGRVEEIRVTPGKPVHVGETLLSVSNEELIAEIAMLKKDVEQKQRDWQEHLAKSEIDLSWRMRTVNKEILQTRLKMTELMKQEFDQSIEQQAWRDFMSKRPGRTKTTSPDDVFRTVSHERVLPGENQFEAMIQLEAARNAGEVSRVQLRLCEERLKELQTLKLELPTRVKKAAGVAEAVTRLDAARESLEKLQSQELTRQIASRGFGQVGTYLRRVGERVKAGDEIVKVTDESQRFLIVEVPAEKLSQFVLGKTLHLVFPDGESHHGKVGKRLESSAANTQSGLTKIRIEPAGKLWPKVPIGSAVEIMLAEK
jgi:biotin carboxyl carrier protein